MIIFISKTKTFFPQDLHLCIFICPKPWLFAWMPPRWNSYIRNIFALEHWHILQIHYNRIPSACDYIHTLNDDISRQSLPSRTLACMVFHEPKQWAFAAIPPWWNSSICNVLIHETMAHPSNPNFQKAYIYDYIHILNDDISRRSLPSWALTPMVWPDQ